MSYHTSSRKIKRLKYLLKRLSSTNRYSNQFKKLISKIQSLANDLKRAFSLQELSKLLGASAMLILTSTAAVDAQQFDTPQANAFGMGIGNQYFFVPELGDLDGDGDYDLIAGNYYGTIQYQRNSGSPTNPVFDAPMTNPFGIADTANWVFPTLGDLDNDGDLDLLIGQYEPDSGVPPKFAYFENIGTPTAPNFASIQLNPFGLTDAYYYSSPSFADLDGDGDLDVFSSTTEKIQYFENTGTPTSPSFASPVDNPFGIFVPPATYYIHLVDFVDLDKDGDLDMISTEYYGDFMYYQNTGTPTNPNFAAPVTNPFDLMPPSFPAGETKMGYPETADLDGDGDFDLILGQYENDSYISLFYYENITAISSNGNLVLDDIKLNIFPNPTTFSLNFSTVMEGNIRATVYDGMGKVILTEHNVVSESDNTLDIGDLPNGIYLLRLANSKGQIVSKPFSVLKE